MNISKEEKIYVAVVIISTLFTVGMIIKNFNHEEPTLQNCVRVGVAMDGDVMMKCKNIISQQ